MLNWFGKKEEKKEKVETVEETIENNFCFNENDILPATKEDIDVVELSENLKCATPHEKRDDSGYHYTRERAYTYSDFFILEYQHRNSRRNMRIYYNREQVFFYKDIEGEITIECLQEWFLPYLKYFCDYIHDAAEEIKRFKYEESKSKIQEKIHDNLCEVKRNG